MDSLKTIRSLSAEATIVGQLLPEQLQIIYDNNWFNIYLPEDAGGLGLSLPEAALLLEQLSAVDGSFGWTVTLCSGANWFLGFLPQSLRKEFFHDATTCLAGSGAADGMAIETGEHYIINGHWKYATGASHATAFTANCIIQRNGLIAKDDSGKPLIRAFIFKPDEITIYPDWCGMGMKATASHSFSITNRTIPKDRCFQITPHHVRLSAPVFYFPFLPFAEITLAVNFSGMAKHWLQCCHSFLSSKINAGSYDQDQKQYITGLPKAFTKAFDEKRNTFFKVLSEIWAIGLPSFKWVEPDLTMLRKLSHDLVKVSLHTVQQLYPLCGLEAATTGTELNRIWLDIHTAGQHSLFRYPYAN